MSNILELNEKLAAAVLEGNVAEVARLLEAGADANVGIEASKAFGANSQIMGLLSDKIFSNASKEVVTDAPKEDVVVTDTPKEDVVVTEAPKEDVVVTDTPKEDVVVTDTPKEDVVVTEAPKEDVVVTDTALISQDLVITDTTL